MYARKYIGVYVCMSKYLYVCLNACMYVCMCVCMYAYMYESEPLYAHTQHFEANHSTH